MADANWILYGLGAAVAASAIPLIQERFKAPAYDVAVWIKIWVVVLTFPFLLMAGWPADPLFYGMTALSGLLWAICDVIFYRSVASVGAGIVSRILPSAIFLAFPVWFIFDPALLDKYLAHPGQSLAIMGILLGASVCVFYLKKCPFSWQAIRMMWFVILAAALGPILNKLCLGYAPAAQAPYAYIVVQGLFMLLFWGLYALYAQQRGAGVVTRASFLAPLTLRAGVMIGFVAAVNMYLKTEALRLCEHPALLSVLLFTDTLWIVLYYRLTGRQDASNMWAGMGLVACAAALVLVKSL